MAGRPKVEDEDIRKVFWQRRELPPAPDTPDVRGKWELSSKEVASLVSDDLPEGEDITRQAIHKRLGSMDDVLRVEHGRTVTWRLACDTLVTEKSHDTDSRLLRLARVFLS